MMRKKMGKKKRVLSVWIAAGLFAGTFALTAEGKEPEKYLFEKREQKVTAAKRIADEIASGRDVITLYESIAVDSAVYIPQGRTVTFCAAEGVSAVLYRAAGFEGAMFEVEKGAALILGEEGQSDGRLVLCDAGRPGKDGFLIQGKGTVKIYDTVDLRGRISDGIMLHKEDVPAPQWDETVDDAIICDAQGEEASYDLGNAEIIFAETGPIIYSGGEKKPGIQVMIDSVVLTRADYTMKYSDNINAGTALITVTGKGAYTGTKSASFYIDPYSVQYGIADQEIESGSELSEIETPLQATGVNGEMVDGTVLWRTSQEGEMLPPDILLSGRQGECMVLYWTFMPDKTDYAPVSGEIKVTFREPERKDNINTNLNLEDLAGGWENGVPNTGSLSTEASAQGTTKGEGISLQIPDVQEEAEKEEAEENLTGDAQKESGTAGYGDAESAAQAGMSGPVTEMSGSATDNPATGDGSTVIFWLAVLMAAFLVSTGGMLSIIMRKAKSKNIKCKG